jgi:2-polyprenyl-3-methyl-5-hydroxy-6-metoxy-1,4-benzoquinol methylase
MKGPASVGILGGTLAYRLLKRLSPAGSAHVDGSAYKNASKLEMLLGLGVWATIRGKHVVDYGSGEGDEVIEMARRGASTVTGVEIQERVRSLATEKALQAGVGDSVQFVAAAEGSADVVVCLDSFEHFADPAAELATMYRVLKPGGLVMASFGPTWYHPYGGHLFSIFPWAHLIFTEEALLRWRSDFRTDGARRFGEVAGGLNQMTLASFERIVDASGFETVRVEAVPIRRIRAVSNRLTREFTTAIVRAQLRKPA